MCDNKIKNMLIKIGVCEVKAKVNIVLIKSTQKGNANCTSFITIIVST